MRKRLYKNDMHLISIAKNSGFGIIGQSFFLLTRFVIAVVITRSIGPDQYGLFVLAMSVLTLAEALGIIGLDVTVVKFVSQYMADKNRTAAIRMIKFAFTTALMVSITISVGIFMASGIAEAVVFHKPGLSNILRVMTIGIPFVVGMQILLSAFQGAKMLKYKIFRATTIVATVAADDHCIGDTPGRQVDGGCLGVERDGYSWFFAYGVSF